MPAAPVRPVVQPTVARPANPAFAIAALVCAVGAACQHGPAPGRERGACRSDTTCDVGLICASNLCVRPPPADCRDVAEQLTSIELGNYAEPEDRAPVVARYQAACTTALVSQREQECLDQAHNAWAAGQCVLRMFLPAST